MKRIVRRFLIAAFVAFLCYSCQIVTNGLEAYKGSVYWEYRDVAAIIVGIVSIAIFAVIVDGLVTWFGRPTLRRLFNLLFLLALAGGLMAIMGQVFLPKYLIALCWMVLSLFIGLSFAKTEWQVERRAASCCFYLSPGLLVVFGQLLFWGRPTDYLENHLPSGTVASAESKKTPVFCFVFDEWSALRCMDNGEFCPAFKNMRTAALNSVVFTNAISPTTATMQSLPRYIYQNDLTYKESGGILGFEQGDSFVPSASVPSIFLEARQNGYMTYLMGFYHAYRKMLGDQVDYFRVFQGNRPPLHSFGHEFLWRLERNGRFLNDPVTMQLDLDPVIGCRQWYEVDAVFRREMLETVSRVPRSSFAFFHVPWPHSPFVCNPDGSPYGFSKELWNFDNTAGYLRHLQYLDTTIGEILNELHAAGKYDDSVLIFTSDHGWRAETDPKFNTQPLYQKRVPLIIKLPRETIGHRIDERFCPSELNPFLLAVFSGEKDTKRLLEILKRQKITKKP